VAGQSATPRHWPWLLGGALAASQPLYFEPGTDYHYSNIGFDTLGLIVSRVASQPLGRVFADRIFRPLGLKETAYDPQGRIVGRHPRGYWMD
jgi:CubicO group peptidase (beta-lactamase class C family)